MTELFAKCRTSDYFANRASDMRQKIIAFSDEQILNADFDEWIDYYFDVYSIAPLILHTDNTEQVVSKIEIERQSELYGAINYGPRTFRIDGCKFEFTIPFDGDNYLLFLTPSTFYQMRFIVDSFRQSTETDYGHLVFSLEYSNSELQTKTPDSIVLAFQGELKYYIETINRINNEAENYNNRLADSIRAELERRKSRADEFASLVNKFAVPLKNNPNAPKINPVPLKKAIKEKRNVPTVKPKKNEYAVEQSDYDNIRKIVYTAGSSMEKTALTYAKLNEEGLRDVIMSILNSHYKNSATGETFSKVGKADIHLPFENRAAYIAECKIWSGQKCLENALRQLLSYTTWCDVRNSIIIFNKDNKDFQKVISAIANFLSSNDLCVKQSANNHNEWHCTFKKDKESTQTVDIQIVVFDLHL